MVDKTRGRYRADVQVSVLDSFELRSRRSIREAEKVKLSRANRRYAKELAKADAKFFATQVQKVRSGAYLVPAARKVPFYSRRGFRNTVTMSIATGLFTTFALPAYAYDPDVAAMSRFTTTDAQAIAAAEGTQNLTVAAVNTVKFSRGQYESADAQEIARQETLNNYRTYTGPTAADYVKNPPYSKLDGATILMIAAKYVGTPYILGGANPSGFDCSGYVAFIFSQFGIRLPHSVVQQRRHGIVIKPEDAMPGDIVVWNDGSHNGVYAGNGNFYHAPRPGDRVKLAPIFSSNVHFMRFATETSKS